MQVDPERRDQLLLTFGAIFKEGVLSPSDAGKLKGKLLFAASQLWGKTGRAFLLALSERQYAPSHVRNLNPAIRLALEAWEALLLTTRPRPIRGPDLCRPTAVLFTDGCFPLVDRGESGVPGVGGICFQLANRPTFVSAVVGQDLLDEWIPRQTQIVMIELLAAVAALRAFADSIKNGAVVLFVDSEAVEGALVKGYSGRADLCRLVGLFWAIAHDLCVFVYIDRVPTDANPSDAPSRHHCEALLKAGWLQVDPMLPTGRWDDLRAWDGCVPSSG